MPVKGNFYDLRIQVNTHSFIHTFRGSGPSKIYKMELFAKIVTAVGKKLNLRCLSEFRICLFLISL